MSVNRYLNPLLLQYQSQFVPEQIPWDVIYAQGQNKQKKEDDFKVAESKLGDLQIVGEEYFTDNEGRLIAAPDRQLSAQAVNAVQEELKALSAEYAIEERGSVDYLSKFNKLQEKYNRAKELNARLEQRSKAYQENMKIRKDKKVNFGDHIGTDWDDQVYRMLDIETYGLYTPETMSYQDQMNRNERTNTIMSGIKDQVQDFFSGPTGDGYIKSYNRWGILPEKIYQTMSSGFIQDLELQQDIDLEIKQRAKGSAYTQKGSDKSQVITSPNQIIDYEVTDKNGNPKTIQISFAEAVKRDVFNDMVANAMKFEHSAQSGSTASDSWTQKKIDEANNLPMPSLHLSKATTPWDEMLNAQKRKDNYKKGQIRLLEINGKLAAIEKAPTINNARDYKDLMEEKQLLLNEQASFEGSLHNVKTQNLENLKEDVLKDIDDKVMEAHKIIAAYEKNPLITDESGNLEANYNQAKKDASQLLRNKSAIQKAKNYTELEDQIKGTSLQTTYENKAFDYMKSTPKQEEFYGFSVTDENGLKAIENLLYVSNLNFTGLDGEKITFNGKMRDNAQIGFTHEGQPFVSVVEDETNFGTKEAVAKTVLLDPRDPYVSNEIRKITEKATTAYNNSGGKNTHAKAVMDRGHLSLALNSTIISNNQTSINKLGAWGSTVTRSQPGHVNYLTVSDIINPTTGDMEDLHIMATTKEDGSVDVVVAKKINNTLEYFDPFVGTPKEGLRNFKDINHAFNALNLVK